MRQLDTQLIYMKKCRIAEYFLRCTSFFYNTVHIEDYKGILYSFAYTKLYIF